MMIRHRIGAVFIALAVAGAWTLPVRAAEEPAPAAEVTAAAAPATTDTIKTAAPAAKVTKPRVVRHRVVKRFWRYRPIRVAVADWTWARSHSWSGSHVILGGGF